MANGQVSEIVPAASHVAFDLIHDYTRRLEWDTLLQAAYLDGAAAVAGKGVTAVCVGRKSLGGIPIRTVYVSFDRPKVAAVKMVNAPAFFGSWAASIRHEDISDQESRIIYRFHFVTKPRILRFILDPIMQRVFMWETRKRLRALKAFFTRDHGY
jgi:polyketide cyclase/dehydrase/lipid transport protein